MMHIQRTPPARRSEEDGPLTIEQYENARRLSEYIQKRQGQTAGKIKLQKFTR